MCPENILDKKFSIESLLPLCCKTFLKSKGLNETFYLLIYSLKPGMIRPACTVVYNNNFGLQGKLLWKSGSTERVWKPLKRCICSTGWCAGLRICIIRQWIWSTSSFTSLLWNCFEWQIAAFRFQQLNTYTHNTPTEQWCVYTPSEPAHILQGANHAIVDHVRALPGAVIDRSVSMKGCGLQESSWVVLWRDILNKIYSRESACP